MLSSQKTQQLITYWLESANEKYKTAQTLYKSKRYADCLFFCHLVLEKVLKALAIKTNRNPAPYTHNLPYLAQLAHLRLGANELKLLTRTNQFNMEARYPDEKLGFYKLCTKSYTDLYYLPIFSLYKKICRLIMSK